jgi:hypothetical protein
MSASHNVLIDLCTTDAHGSQAGLSFSSHVLAVVPALIIGVAAGLFAIAFTYVNIKVEDTW